MKIFNLIIVISISILFLGCATTSAVLLDETKQYPSTKNVHIINSIPYQPYHIIAELETKGSNGQSIPQLLDKMRKKAMSIGANAIIPTKENFQQAQVGIIFNPWVGENQSDGSENIPIVRGLAIVYEDINYSDNLIVKQNRYKNLYFGAGINGIPAILNGVGGAVWIKYKNVRFNIEYSNFDVPSSWYAGGLEKGITEDALRIGFDYFFWKNLSGIYLPIGIEYSSNSVGHERYETRAEFNTTILSSGIGYVINITEKLYIDSRFLIGLSLGGTAVVRTNEFVFVTNVESNSAMFSFGFKF